MILGRHNAHLTIIKDEDDDDKWTGDAEAYLVETLLEGDDRQSQIWRSYLAIPSNLPVTIEPGDKAVYTMDGATKGPREIRDVLNRRLFGVIRLHFADR